MPEEKLIEVPEVLRRLKVSRKTLYSLMKEGKIKPIAKPSYLKRAAKLQFKESDVDRLINGEPDPNPKDCVAA
jgi:predicted DNA-binding transcriptional regulator AlpA